MDKSLIRSLCEQAIRKRMAPVRESLERAQSAANDATKSSAGDKHETSRALAHAEVERLGKQLGNLNGMLDRLLQIDVDRKHGPGALGSYICTSQADFYLSVGLGEVKNEEHRFFAIACHSPVGKQLMNSKPGDHVVMGDRRAEVLSVC